MTSSPPERWVSRSRSAALVCAAIGATVLAGWTFDVAALKSFTPGLVAMKANTAVALVLLGAALWLKSYAAARPSRQRRLAANALAGAAALLGTLTLAEYATGRSFGIDELLFSEPAGAIGTLAPGRMAPASAICFILLGLALTLDETTERRGRLVHLLAVASAVPALGAGLSYLYGASNFYGLGRNTQLAVPTVVALLVLVAGVLCRQPDRGLLGLLGRDDAGGMTARRLLPVALLLPATIGLLKVTGDRAGLWEPRYGVVLVALTHIVLYSAIAVWVARFLSRADAERDLAAAALGESEGRFRALFEQSPAVRLLIDPATGDIVDANAAAVSFYGVAAERLRTMSVSQINMLSAAELQRELLRAGSAGGYEEFFFRHRLASGDVRDVQVFSGTVQIGDRVLLESVVHDVTEQKAAEQALAESHAFNEALLKTMPFGIDIVDARGRILFMNDAMERVAGRSATGEYCWDVYKDDRQQCADCPLARPIRVGETQTMESTGVLGGRIFEIAHTGMIYQGELAVLEIFHDVTDRKKVEERLHISEKMEAVGQLAGGVAHDFNNLLTVINGQAEIALGRSGEDTELRHRLEEILSAGGRAEGLTRQLLAFGRKQIVQPRIVDLNAAIADAEKLLRRLVGEDVELTLSLSTDLGRVLADPSQLGQVLMNLAVNARDAMPDGGELTIETSRVDFDERAAGILVNVAPGSYVMLAVSDTGRGIDSATRARLFEPFFTTKPAGKGTGLGLSTVYGIVKQMNGAITVYSEPDKGACFKLYFPCVEAPITEASRHRAPAPATFAEHILLVEDEELIRDLIVEVLELQGYRITAAGDPTTALELGDFDYDLVITDVVMPKLNGRELVARLRAGRPNLKALYMSGYTSTAIVERGVLESEIDFLQKPFSLLDLTDKVREVLDR